MITEEKFAEEYGGYANFEKGRDALLDAIKERFCAFCGGEEKEAGRIAERQDFLCGIAYPIADRVFFDSGVSESHDCLDWNDDDLAIAIRGFMESVAFDLG